MALDTWDDEKIAKLRKMVAAGTKFSAIGAELGVTKNAALGKAHRLGIAQPARPRCGRVKQPDARVPSRRLRYPHPTALQVASGAAKVASKSARFLDKPAPAVDTPPDKLLSFEDVDHGHCRYIYGHPFEDSHGYCGREQVPGLPYCELHVRKCYTPSLPGRANGQKFVFGGGGMFPGGRGSRPAVKTAVDAVASILEPQK